MKKRKRNLKRKGWRNIIYIRMVNIDKRATKTKDEKRLPSNKTEDEKESYDAMGQCTKRPQLTMHFFRFVRASTRDPPPKCEFGPMAAALSDVTSGTSSLPSSVIVHMSQSKSPSDWQSTEGVTCRRT